MKGFFIEISYNTLVGISQFLRVVSLTLICYYFYLCLYNLVACYMIIIDDHIDVQIGRVVIIECNTHNIANS